MIFSFRYYLFPLWKSSFVFSHCPSSPPHIYPNAKRQPGHLVCCSQFFFLTWFFFSFLVSGKLKIIFVFDCLFFCFLTISAPECTLVVSVSLLLWSGMSAASAQGRLWWGRPRCPLRPGALLPWSTPPPVLSLPSSHWRVSSLPSWMKSWWMPWTTSGSFWGRVDDEWMWTLHGMFSVCSHFWVTVWLGLGF